MDISQYATLIGKIVANLQALEFTLRAYLYNQAHPPPVPHHKNLFSVKLGENVPANEMTDYSTLGQLIDRYNRINPDPKQKVDRSLVDIRDAFAHGRVFAPFPEPTFTLLKFGPVKNEETTVTYLQELTEDWLDQQVKRIASEVRKIPSSNIK
jgi:hypothetical protein